ncbi:hypothetical protein ACLKA6_000993 [Drosophila palustris]
MPRFAKNCGASSPESLRGTKLRTYTSMLNVKDAQIDRLANFMGYHKDIHKGVYRVQASITEITEVSKMLMAALNNDKESDDDPDQNSSEDESALNNPSTPFGKTKRMRWSQEERAEITSLLGDVKKALIAVSLTLKGLRPAAARSISLIRTFLSNSINCTLLPTLQ